MLLVAANVAVPKALTQSSMLSIWVGQAWFSYGYVQILVHYFALKTAFIISDVLNYLNVFQVNQNSETKKNHFKDP